MENLKTERKEIRELVFQSIFNKGTFIDEGMDAEKRELVKSLTLIEDHILVTPGDNKANYSCDVVDVILEESDNGVEEMKPILIQAVKQLLGQNLAFNSKYQVNDSLETVGKLVISSKTYVNVQKAKEIIFEDEKVEMVNKEGEIKYVETGEEQKIAIDAGNSRPYTDFFDEFVPNTKKESERAHKYTVSIHRAI